jgi:glycosyltransferase involved in cell wall biosynthesis
MRIGINARILISPKIRGWARYAGNLLRELSAQGIELVLYSHQPLDPAFTSQLRPDGHVVRISPAMPYLLWEERWLPRQCAVDGVSLLHSPFNFGLSWRNSCPQVLTLHDAMYKTPSFSRMLLKRREWETSLYHWVARSRAQRIITVTEFAKKELVNVLAIEADRISVTYEGADPAFTVRPPAAAIQSVRRKYGLDRPYFFYVGGWDQHKNVPFLISAFEKASLTGVDLVVGGGLPHEMEAMAKSIPAGVRLLGWLFDDDLVPLYAGALAFVHPSHHESFGLQLCEAMGLSCPVLAARAGAFPEVLAGGGETFSVDSPDELIGLLRRAATDSAFREGLAGRAARRSVDLSWRRTAEQTIAIYKSVIAEHQAAVRVT